MTRHKRDRAFPPRLAEWLLRHCLPEGIAERSIRGDLREEYASLRSSRSSSYAYSWYWLHTMRLCLRFLGRGTHENGFTAPLSGTMGSIHRDVGFAARSLAKSPGFFSIAVFTLALGIGASTVAFTLVNGVLIRPLPFPEADRLMMLREQRASGQELKLSFPTFEDWRNDSRSFEGIFAIQFAYQTTILGADEPTRGTILRVSREFFDVLGIQPAIGRAISHDENRVGGEVVAVLSYEFWERTFGNRADLDGASISINGNPIPVVGVMPPGFKLLEEGDVYLPLEQSAFRVRDSHNYRAIGRLADGVSVELAQREMNDIATRIKEAYPDGTMTVAAGMTPLREEILGDVDRPLLMVLVAAGVLLLIACSNVASTLMARGIQREREMAIRTAIGASRLRLFQQLCTESILLAGLAALLGLGMAHITIGAIQSLGVDLLPRLQTVSMDVSVLLFAFGASAATSIVFGLVPALRASAQNVEPLSSGQRGNTRFGKGIGGNVLVAGEAFLVIVLVAASGLLLRSLREILSAETNFRPEGVLTVTMDLLGGGYQSGDERAVLLREIKREFEALPGVTAVGYVSHLPDEAISMSGPVFQFPAPESRDPNRPGISSGWRVVDTDYFTAMGIPLLGGRFFTDEDRADTPPVVILNSSLARRTFSGQDAIGQRVEFVPFWMDVGLTVVGVVAEARDWRRAPGNQTEAFVHWPQQLGYTRDLSAVIRCSGDPAELIRPARERLRAVAPTLPGTFRTMESRLRESLSERSFTLAVLGSIAIISLVLAAVGIYGVVSYAVSSRSREIGIRLALGAGPQALRRKLFFSALGVVAVGALAGVIGAMLLGGTMEGLLYEVDARDPITLAVAPAVLFLAATLAVGVPVFRCTRVDPVEVLREE